MNCAKFYILFVFLLFFSCAVKDKEPDNISGIEGIYRSYKPNFLMRFLKHAYYLKDVELHLKKRRNYVYRNCSQESYGTWERRANRIILFCYSTKLVNETGFLRCRDTIYFLWDGNVLKTFFKIKGKKIELRLIKGNARDD